MSLSRKRSKGSSTRMGGLLLGVLLAAVVAPAVASMDPSLCPFELGYNPVFNADGSVLSCQKGAERFTVEAPTGVNARALRGIGANLQTIQIAATQLDLPTFASLVDAGVQFFLQDGVPRGFGDPVLTAFLTNPAVFTYAPGIDVHSIFDVTYLNRSLGLGAKFQSGVWQVTNFYFWGGNPSTAFIHVRLITQTSYVDYDSVWRFNDVSGTRVWQLYQAFNLVVVAK